MEQEPLLSAGMDARDLLWLTIFFWLILARVFFFFFVYRLVGQYLHKRGNYGICHMSKAIMQSLPVVYVEY